MKMNSFLATPLRIAVSTALTLAACGPVLRAADGNPPDKLTYQGYLVDAAGSALGLTAPKNYDVIFRIYNHETASGTTYRLWSELQTVTVDKGYFSVVLGEGGAWSTEARPGLSTLFTNQVDASDRFIEMTVRGIGASGADSTILPRLRLLSSPYALLARTAVNAKYLANVAGGEKAGTEKKNVGRRSRKSAAVQNCQEVQVEERRSEYRRADPEIQPAQTGKQDDRGQEHQQAVLVQHAPERRSAGGVA